MKNLCGYEDLLVYKYSYAAVIEVYRETEGFPRDEIYGIRNQIRRSAVSVSLNIAEGYAKGSGKAELKRYLEISRGSCAEVKVLCCMCRDLAYMPQEKAAVFINEYDKIGRMLTNLIKTLT